jgi:nitrogen PTS system EIIA component
MASKEFDVAQLAAYLHVTPEQVLKMVSREQIPGRKVAGQWRFSQSDVHHWLEERIGASDIEGLTKVEAILGQDEAADEPQYESLVDLLHPDAISIPLPARTRSSVIREMCQLAGNTGLLWDVTMMADAVAAREELHPTALESGVALLHPRRPQSSILAQPLLCLGITSQPLPFGNRAGQLTDIFFLLCSTDDKIHLRTLARLSRLLADNVWLTELRSVTNAAEAIELIRVGEHDLIVQSL